jgi:hypothetical protein
MAESKDDPVIILERALALVFDAIAIAQRGLRANPTKEEERKLNKTLAQLEVERADLEGMIDALENKPTDVPPPTQEQVDRIAELTGRVEQQARASVTAAGALAIASDVLDLAINILSDKG